MKNIAIITARSGSKGLKDKNIKELNEKPLMAYSIEAALVSGCFDEVMVSTDSEKYAEIAKKSLRYGGKSSIFWKIYPDTGVNRRFSGKSIQIRG